MFVRGWGCLLMLLGLMAIGCSSGPTASGPTKPPEVIVTQPVVKQVTDYDEFTGRTESPASVTIRARVTGYLDKVLYKEGNEVNKGDVLFEIDPRPYQAQLDQDKADVANKKAAAIKAEAVWKRSEALLRSGAATREDIDTQKGDYEVARAAIVQSEAKVRASQLNLDWTKVTAPITGRASRQLIDPGNLVMADQTALTTIVALDPIYVYFDIDERTVLRFRRLMRQGKIKSYREAEIPVQIALADESDFNLTGKINFADNTIDPRTGTLRVRAVVENPERLLSPGLFVRVRVRIGTPHDSILIPEKAMGTDQGQKFLYVVNDQDTVEYRQVKIGTLTDGLRVIDEGLKPGERVIVSGLQRVRPGAKVDPKPAPPTPTGPKTAAPAASVRVTPTAPSASTGKDAEKK